MQKSRAPLPVSPAGPGQPLRVLVIGVYLADRPNTVSHLVERFGASEHLFVEQRWVALNGISDDPRVVAVTREQRRAPASKFGLLNAVLRDDDLPSHDFIVVADDDILVPHGCLEALFAWQERFDFALAQPARTWLSEFDHAFVLRRPWLRARRTLFVECGPLVSFRRDAAALLLPFDDDTPLWGVDLVWPKVLDDRGLRLGVIDAVAVDHSLRGQAASYDAAEQRTQMARFLQRRPHLAMADAFVVLERHPVGGGVPPALSAAARRRPPS